MSMTTSGHSQVTVSVDKNGMTKIREALKRGMPVFAICRGFQVLSCVLGGTLYQDLPTQLKSETEHHQKAPYDVPVHSVIINKGSG